MARGPVLTVTITGDTKGFSKATGQATTAASGMGKKISGFAVGAGAAITSMAISAVPQLLNMGKEMLNLGKASAIMDAKAGVVFGKSADDIRTWADSVNESFGLSDEAVVGMAASMGDLLKPMGFTEAATADMTKTMLDAAGALSAWSGGKYDAAAVSDIMTKAMLGETDGLKALGISISAADVEARLAAKGQKELTGQQLEQARALAIQELMLEKSSDAQNAWNDGTMDATKQANEMNAMFADAKEAIGKALVPAMEWVTRMITTKVVPAVRALIEEFRERWPQIKAAVQPVLDWFGRTIATTIEFAKAAWEIFGETIMTRAKIAFEMVKGYLQGLIDYITGVFKFVSSLVRGDWGKAWEGAKQAVRGAVKMIRSVVLGLFRSLKEIIRFGMEMAGKLIRKGWDLILSLAKKAIAAYVQYWKDLPGRIAWVIAHLWDGFKEGIGRAKDWARERIADIVGFVKGIPGRIADTIRGLWANFKEGIRLAKQFAGDRFDDIVSAVTGLPSRIASAASGMWDGIRDAFKAAINWIIDAWNRLEFTLPSVSAFGVEIGGQTIGTPDIPRLEHGGIVKRRPGGVLAIIGEGAYDEAVIPLRPGAGQQSTGGTVINHWPAGVNPTTVARAQRTYARLNGPEALVA